jgi:hypothetical protein
MVSGKLHDLNMTQETRDNCDRAAKAKALIMLGKYDWTGTEWEGKKPPAHNDGSPRAPVKVLFKVGGWNENNNMAYKYINSTYFFERFNYWLQSLNGELRKELERVVVSGAAARKMSIQLFNLLMEEMLDPERARRIPFSTKMNFFKELTAMADEKDQGGAEAKQASLTIGNVNQFIASTNADPAAKEAMQRGLAKAHEDVTDIIEGAIAVADAGDAQVTDYDDEF